MAQGKVKAIKSDKGFGFIIGEVDIFFHESEILNDTDWDNMEEGDNVTFDVYIVNNKIKARNIRLIKNGVTK